MYSMPLLDVVLKLQKDYPDPIERAKVRAEILRRAGDKVRAEHPEWFPHLHAKASG